MDSQAKPSSHLNSPKRSRRAKVVGGVIAVAVMAGLGGLAWYLTHQPAAPAAGMAGGGGGPGGPGGPGGGGGVFIIVHSAWLSSSQTLIASLIEPSSSSRPSTKALPSKSRLGWVN